jgi:hypothetical protein
VTYDITLAGPQIGASLILSLDEECAERRWRLLSAYVDDSGLHAVVRARQSAAKVASALAQVGRLRLLGSVQWRATGEQPQPKSRTAFYVASQ